MYCGIHDSNRIVAWRWAPLCASLAIATIFLATWLSPATRGSWDQLDLLVFRSLNNTLAFGAGWQRLWAIGNWRGFDVISGLAVLTLSIRGFRECRWSHPVRPWISLALLMATIGLTQRVISESLISDWLEYRRPSPTQVLDQTWRLSQLVPDIPCKDTSPYSFPGDHGFVLLSLALYVSYWAKPTTVQGAWWLAGCLALPRLVAGAHWFTDIGIGSACMALVSTSLLMATPLHDRIVDSVQRMVLVMLEWSGWTMRPLATNPKSPPNAASTRQLRRNAA